MATFFTVTQADWIDGCIDSVSPFKQIYTTKQKAMEAVEEAARELHEYLQADDAADMPKYEFPGLSWDTAKEVAQVVDTEGDDRPEWLVTEVVVES